MPKGKFIRLTQQLFKSPLKKEESSKSKLKHLICNNPKMEGNTTLCTKTKQAPKLRWLMSVLFLCCSVWLLTLFVGCGVEAWVEAKEELKITLDLDAFLKQGKIDKAKAFPRGKVPHNLKVHFPFWYLKTYDLNQNKEVKKYREQIRDIRIKILTYQVTKNTLTVDLPSQGQKLEVFAAKKGVKDTSVFAEIGYLLPIPNGRTGITDRLYFLDKGKEKTNKLLKDFAIEVGFKGTLSIDGSQDKTVPEGKIELTITLAVAFTVDVKL